MAVMEPPRPKRWTRKEFYAMAELGWFESRHVELIEGEIVEISPQNALHAALTERIATILQRSFGNGHVVRRHSPLALPGNSELEPDIAVVRGTMDEFAEQHPKYADLVVEISLSSLHHDRERKGPLYARAGITEFWIVNLSEELLEVYRDPKRTARGFRYGTRRLLGRTDSVAALALPKVKFLAKEFLPVLKS